MASPWVAASRRWWSALPPATSLPPLPPVQPIRVTGVFCDRSKFWLYSYYVNGPAPRWRRRGGFSIARFGFDLAKLLAERCRLAAERAGIAVITDSSKVTRLKTPAPYQSMLNGVRWNELEREWRVDWIAADSTGFRRRLYKIFPVGAHDDIDQVRLDAESFRCELDSKPAMTPVRRVPRRADFSSGVAGVNWQGSGAGEIRNGVWQAVLLYRRPNGTVHRRIRKGFAANKYGFEGAKRLAIEAVRNHDPNAPVPLL